MASGELLTNSMVATRRATTKLTTISATVSAETVVGTITAVLESGKTYGIMFHGRIGRVGGATTDFSVTRIREDNISGTVLQFAEAGHPVTNALAVTAYTEFVAGSTGSKTFVVTLATGAAGTFNRSASASAPSFITVDLIPT
jgi:hypothetical protein